VVDQRDGWQSTDERREDEALDRAFLALADPIRRAMVARLARGDATVNELAAPFAITKQAVSKHIQVLQHAGLVTRSRDAQRRPVHLDPAALERLTAWIDRYRLIAEDRFRQLDALLAAPPPTAPDPPHPQHHEQQAHQAQAQHQEHHEHQEYARHHEHQQEEEHQA
jgi:DNA-binding transcriptional ArsR family regulator